MTLEAGKVPVIYNKKSRKISSGMVLRLIRAIASQSRILDHKEAIISHFS
jgi:hypothetical protein